VLDAVTQVALVAVEAQAKGDVVEDAHRERVRLLKHHADIAAHDHWIDALAIDVLAEEMHMAFEAKAFTRSFMRLRLRSTVLCRSRKGR
jgi:hypothetical protein